MPDCLIAQVDAHNLVLRFNGAPTAGFEPVVGSKTSLSMLNTQAMGQILERCSPASTCSGTGRDGSSTQRPKCRRSDASIEQLR